MRGQGVGKGGRRQGLGPNPMCRCPKCGYSTMHQPGIPCMTLTCPKCGSKMIGV